jgi:hypothetical protein
MLACIVNGMLILDARVGSIRRTISLIRARGMLMRMDFLGFIGASSVKRMPGRRVSRASEGTLGGGLVIL